MLVDYIANWGRAENLCDEFASRVEQVYFSRGEAERSYNLKYYQEDYYRELITPVKSCVKLCQVLNPQKFEEQAAFFYEEALRLENDAELEALDRFRSFLETVKLGFSILKNERLAFSSSFDEEEKERMNEALHNYFEHCYYSCVAMSVSTVESRLLKLMCLASPQSQPELDEKTLGQLIYEYTNNKGRYKNVVPKKHEPLLQLCNTYRTFSVHPKKERIKPTIAISILNLSIEFLIDQNTKPEVIKAQLIVKEDSK